MKRFLLLLAALFLAPSTVVQATEIACGMVISENTKLEENLDCRGTGSGGLEIGADNVTVDLNGYTIFGDHWAPYGISGIERSGITIMNGAISGFMSGVLIDHSRQVAVEQLTFAHQAIESVFVGHSSHARVEDIQISLDWSPSGYETIGVLLLDVKDARLENVVAEGSFYGMQSLDSQHVRVIDSSFTDIWHVGVRLVNNRNSLFENNRVVGADRSVCYSAMDIAGPEPSSQVRFHANTLAECSHGVFLGHFSDDPPHQKISIRDNRIRLTYDGIRLFKTVNSEIMGNRLHFNGIGIVLLDFSTQNRIFGNTSTGNEILDITHDDSSVPNLWINNTCVTTDMGDVDCH